MNELQALLAAAWDESRHPRDQAGRFGEGGGGGGGGGGGRADHEQTDRMVGVAERARARKHNTGKGHEYLEWITGELRKRGVDFDPDERPRRGSALVAASASTPSPAQLSRALSLLGRAMALKAAWDESKHPRGDGGKFTTGGGGGHPSATRRAERRSRAKSEALSTGRDTSTGKLVWHLNNPRERLPTGKGLRTLMRKINAINEDKGRREAILRSDAGDNFHTLRIRVREALMREERKGTA